MSSGRWTAVGSGIYGTGAAPKVGYPNGSDGAAPLSHAGMFSGGGGGAGGGALTAAFLC